MTSSLLTANTREPLWPAAAAPVPSLTDDPAVFKNPVMSPLEVITWQVSANSPHALLNSPSLPAHAQL